MLIATWGFGGGGGGGGGGCCGDPKPSIERDGQETQSHQCRGTKCRRRRIAVGSQLRLKEGPLDGLGCRV